MEPRILVLDGNQRASLAAVRSLGSKGLWIAVGENASTFWKSADVDVETRVDVLEPCLLSKLMYNAQT